MKERDDAMGRYCSSKECVQMGLWLVTFNVVLNIWPRHKQIVAIDTDWEIHNITRYTITLEIHNITLQIYYYISECADVTLFLLVTIVSHIC